MQRSADKVESGFTLVELVIAIAILAILAAVALPKYVTMQRDAHVAKMQSVHGSLRSAAVLAKARCELDLVDVASGNAGCTTSGGQVNMDGTLVTMVNRYPTANLAGIVAATQLNASTDGFAASPGGAGPGDTFTLDLVSAPTPSACRITYTAALSAGVAPVFVLDTSGC